jgi:hypothetical protein
MANEAAKPVRYLPTPEHLNIYQRVERSTFYIAKFLDDDDSTIAPEKMAKAVVAAYEFYEKEDLEKDKISLERAEKSIKDLVKTMM